MLPRIDQRNFAPVPNLLIALGGKHTLLVQVARTVPRVLGCSHGRESCRCSPGVVSFACIFEGRTVAKPFLDALLSCRVEPIVPLVVVLAVIVMSGQRFG